jgi:hypothetical protein
MSKTRSMSVAEESENGRTEGLPSYQLAPVPPREGPSRRGLLLRVRRAVRRLDKGPAAGKGISHDAPSRRRE